MKKLTLSLAAVVAVSSLISTLSAAESTDGFNIFDDMKFEGEIRPRFEYGDNSDDTETSPAKAMTARTSLGVNAKLFEVDGLSTYIEGTSVNNFGYRKYNSTANKKTKYDKVVDPQQARLTQAYIDYKVGETLIRAGRQVVNLDDQRFVGAVAWRQMFQTFDAVSVIDNTVENLTLLASYVYGYQGVKALPTTNTHSALLNAKYKILPELAVTGYGYFLADIHNTYGVRANGEVALAKGMSVNYDASYALQKTATLNYSKPNADIDAHYYNVAVGANLSGFLMGADYEVLGKAKSTSVDGFSTPLATLHKFNGWADVFLGRTNGSGKNINGLVDMNAKVGYKAKGFGKVLAIFHKFDAQAGADSDLGKEVDFLYVNKIKAVKGLKALVKGSYYAKGDTGSNKTVAWLMLDYKFKTK